MRLRYYWCVIVCWLPLAIQITSIHLSKDSAAIHFDARDLHLDLTGVKCLWLYCRKLVTSSNQDHSKTWQQERLVRHGFIASVCVRSRLKYLSSSLDMRAQSKYRCVASQRSRVSVLSGDVDCLYNRFKSSLTRNEYYYNNMSLETVAPQ